MSADAEGHATSPPERVRPHIVDCDVHNELKGGRAALKPYMASEWHPFLDAGVNGAGRSFYPSGSPSIMDAIREDVLDGFVSAEEARATYPQFT